MNTVGKIKKLILILALATGVSVFAFGTTFADIAQGGTYNYGRNGNGTIGIVWDYSTSGATTLNHNTENVFFTQDQKGSNHFYCNLVLCDPSESSPGKDVYIAVDSANCSNAIKTFNKTETYSSSIKPSSTTIFINISGTEHLKGLSKSVTGCTLKNSTSTQLTVSQITVPPPKQTTPASTSSTTPTCEASGGVLDWIFCAVYNALNSVTAMVLKYFIIPQLKISPLCISSTTGPNCTKGDPTYQIWSSFRLYGDIILVIALMVIVASEAMGGGLIDAYSVRKILPRILVAAVLLNLSIYIVAALVDVTNIIGGSIGAVITGPLKNAGAFHISPSGGIVLATVGVGALFLGGGALHLLSHTGTLFSHTGGSFLVDGILVPILLIFLGILITIVIRKTAIIALIILSPLAFAFYVLPNTQKLFKRWWDLLLEMLMVYPIIVLIFAVSSVMSVLVSTSSAGNTGGIGGAINSLLALVFTVLPLVLVPFSFKLAGDTIGRIASFVDGGRSKIMGMTQNKRQRSREAYAARLAGERSKQYSRLANTRPGQWLSKESGASKWVGRGFRRNYEQATQAATLAAGGIPKLPGWATMEHNTNALVATTNGGNFEKTWREIQELNGKDENGRFKMSDDAAQASARSGINTARTAIGFGQAQALTAARQRIANGTDVADAAQMHRMISQVSAGNDSLAWSLAGDLNAVSKQVGRHDLAGGVGKIKEMSDLYRLEGLGLGGQQWQNSGKTVSEKIEEGKNEAAIAGWDSATLGQHATNKTLDIQNSIVSFTKMLRSTNPKHKQEAARFFKEIKGMRNYPYASGDFLKAINSGLSAGITDERGNNVSIESYVDNYTNSLGVEDRENLNRTVRNADSRPPSGIDGTPNTAPQPPSEPGLN